LAVPQNIANSTTPGTVVALGTLTAELKTGEVELKVSAKPPAALEAAGQFTIIIDSEIMIVTAGQKTTEWTVTRKAESSTEANHLVGAEVLDYLTAEALKLLIGESGLVKTEGLASEAVTAAKIAKETVTAEKLAKEEIATAQVKKEGLEPNRLEKEKITSEQVKAKGLTAADLKDEEITSTQIKPRGIKSASLAIPWKEPVAYATTEVLNGEPEVAGEVIKSKKEEKLKVDGAEPVAKARILVKNSANPKDNGLYEVVKAGKAGEKWELKRTTDANNETELQDATVSVEKGAVNGGSFWVQIAKVTTVGTTEQLWQPLNTGLWQVLESVNASLKAFGMSTPEVRREGGRAFLKGAYEVTAEIATEKALFTVPFHPLAAEQPPATFVAEAGKIEPTFLSISTAGVVICGQALPKGCRIHFGGVSWPLM